MYLFSYISAGAILSIHESYEVHLEFTGKLDKVSCSVLSFKTNYCVAILLPARIILYDGIHVPGHVLVSHGTKINSRHNIII